MKTNRSNRKLQDRKATPATGKRVRQKGSGGVVSRNGRVKTTVLHKASTTDDIQYVLPLGNGWVVKASNANTFTAITDSKTEAISIARTIALTKHTKLIVHGRNGQIEMKESYVA